MFSMGLVEGPIGDEPTGYPLVFDVVVEPPFYINGRISRGVRKKTTAVTRGCGDMPTVLTSTATRMGPMFRVLEAREFAVQDGNR